jgi:hypothetical protein
MPWRGESREEWQIFICGFQASRDAMHCDQDSAWHGFAVGDHGIKAMMTSCDEHADAMRQVAEYVHPLVHPCGIPGSMFRWPENECYTDWDEQAEFTQALTAGNHHGRRP